MTRRDNAPPAREGRSPSASRDVEPEDRTARLARALRENLKRRKAQQRAATEAETRAAGVKPPSTE